MKKERTMKKAVVLCVLAAVCIAGPVDATPITINGFSGSETIFDFSGSASLAFPRYGNMSGYPEVTTDPVTFGGVTFSEHGSGVGWAGLSVAGYGGYFSNIPGASYGLVLAAWHGTTDLRLDFSSVVRRAGILVASAVVTTYTMYAYDDSLTLLGSSTATLPSGFNAVFIGEEFDRPIGRIEIVENGSNNWETYFQQLRFEPVPEPASLLFLTLGGLTLMRRRRRSL